MPRISVVVPTYNQATYLVEAIESVLNQSFTDFELIVINDASTDHTDEVMQGFADERIKYIVNPQNRYAAATRNIGIRAASTALIAFLDSDDVFHPDKLKFHIAFLDSHPEIGSSYNSRYHWNHSAKTIRELVRPPLTVSLDDFVLGFPFTTSDMVVRREWLLNVGLFEEDYTWSEELDLNCKLALAGCSFASVDRALNYRRYFSEKVFGHIDDKCANATRAIEKALADPRCPDQTKDLRVPALTNNYLCWIANALIQNETPLAQQLIRSALQLNPSLIEGIPSELVHSMVRFAIYDESLDHELLLRKMFDQLPQACKTVSSQYHWAIGRGHLEKGTRAIIWDRPKDGQAYFTRAIELGAQVDDGFLNKLAYKLLSYELEFGSAATQHILESLSTYLGKLGYRAQVGQLQGRYYADQAFKNYNQGHFNQVPRNVFRAITSDTTYLKNRGLWVILSRSFLHYPQRPQQLF